MSLYNCVLGSPSSNILVKDNQGKVIIDSSTNAYKVYVVPAKFNKKYSLYIDCLSGVEVVAGFYKNKNQIREIQNMESKNPVADLATVSYKKLKGCRFSEAQCYDGLLYNNIFSNFEAEITKSFKLLGPVVSNLCLFIKVPYSNNSSIVVLEESEVNNEKFTYQVNNINYRRYPIILTNYDKDSKALSKFDHYISSSQLTYINDGNIYPFADRLIEYLTGNAITPLDNIPHNLERVETGLINNKVIDTYTPNLFWTNELRARLYLKANSTNLMSTKTDILGYVDKDIEYNLVGESDSSSKMEV